MNNNKGILHNVKKLVVSNINTGYTILGVFYTLTNPIIEYYKVPTYELKRKIMENRTNREIDIQSLLDNLIELEKVDKKTAEKLLKQYVEEQTQGFIDNQVMNSKHLDSIKKSYKTTQGVKKGIDDTREVVDMVKGIKGGKRKKTLKKGRKMKSRKNMIKRKKSIRNKKHI